jgi:hypothetical protein
MKDRFVRRDAPYERSLLNVRCAVAAMRRGLLIHSDAARIELAG